MFNRDEPLKIAVLRLSAIGDVVLVLPLINALQKHFNQATITWIISEPAYRLVQGLPGVRFVVVQKPRSWQQYWACRKRLAAEKFDVLLALQASLSANVLCALVRAPIKIGFDALRARDGQRLVTNHRIEAAEGHLLDGFMQFAKKLGVSDTGVSWHLPLNEVDVLWARQQLHKAPGPRLAINLTASKPERCWPLNYYAAVIEQARQRLGYQVVLLGGSTAFEQQRAWQLQSMLRFPCLNLVGSTSLTQLAALLGEVDVLLSPDSGPVHIANALHTKVVGLYAVASSRLSGPYNQLHRVIDKYPTALQQFCHTSIELVRWQRQRVRHPGAMALITVPEVMQQLSSCLHQESVC